MSCSIACARKEVGAVLVEMAFFLPIMLGLTFLGYEFTKAMKERETLSMVSRETASQTYRDCIQVAPPLTREQCLTNTLNELNPYLQITMPGSDVILSIYRYVEDGDGNPLNNARRVAIVGVDTTNPSEPTRHGFHTQYSEANILTLLTSLTASNPFVAISEIYFTHRTIAPGISGLVNFSRYQPGVFYETTIY